jgi:hypothetical protein
VIAALCLATDLGMGFPFEHGLHSTLVATRLADRLEVDPATASQTYYACLLSHAGCTTDAHVTADLFGDSLTTHLNPVLYGSGREVFAGLLHALPEPARAGPVRALQVARRLPRLARLQRPHFTAMCEVAQMLAEGVGLPPTVQGLLAHLTERWDGKGPLRRAEGEEIPLPMRIVHVAVDATFQRLLGGEEQARRGGRQPHGRSSRLVGLVVVRSERAAPISSVVARSCCRFTLRPFRTRAARRRCRTRLPTPRALPRLTCCWGRARGRS